MTNKAEELNALADRCEREEPGRTLDRAIAAALGYQVEVIEIPEGHPMADVFKAGSGLEFMYRPGCDREGIPPWTRSLDAAVTLVPEPGSWEVGASGCATVTLLCGRFLVSDDVERHAIGRTPALALCAAALRACAALSQTDGAAPETPKVRTPK